MITREQINLVANRYGIKVSYQEPGTGGFIVDESRKIYKSVVTDIEKDFLMEKNKCHALKVGYLIDDNYLYAA